MRLGERPRSLEGKPNDLDLPFTINLYYSMFTISYTPRFPYQFKMTLIEYSRILKVKHNECSRPGQLGACHDSMLTSRSCLTPRTAETCREVPNTLCFPCILECLTKFIVSAVYFYPTSIKIQIIKII